MAGSFHHGNEEAAIKTMGYLLDMDDEYYYLGDNAEEIVQAIRRDKVIWIQILQPTNMYKDMLNQMQVPEDEDKKN